MSKSIDPMGQTTRRDTALEPHPAPIVSMSLRPGIPWRVALPQSPPPLPRLRTSMQHRAGKANLFPANGNLSPISWPHQATALQPHDPNKRRDRFYRAVELMMKIRREERKSREAQAAADDVDAAGPGPPSGRKRYVPAQAPPPIQDSAHQDRESSPDRPRPVIGFQWGRSPGLPGDEPESARGPNEKLQNEAETDLTTSESTSYKETGAIESPPMERPILRSAGLKETCGLDRQPQSL